MTLSRGQFTNVISKGKKMSYKNPTKDPLHKTPAQVKKSESAKEALSEKRKLQMGIIGKINSKLKSLYPVSNKDLEFIKKNMPKIKSKKKLKR